MKKRFLGAALVSAAAVVALASCGGSDETTAAGSSATTPAGSSATTPAGSETTPAGSDTEETVEPEVPFTPAGADADYTKTNSGSIFHIYAWNEEFKGFFEKYITDEGKAGETDVTTYHVDGTEVKWTIVANEGLNYQNAVDEALANNKSASAANKVDMFLAEADYILKYTNSVLTQNVANIGVTDYSQAYQYTVQAAADANDKVKGVSFQCCPSGMVYRRSIAKDVLGVEEPEDVQPLVDTWAKWEGVAAQMKAKGYLMTGSYADSYRVFSNNAKTPWVKDNKLEIPAAICDWITQAQDFVENEYTLTEGVWDGGKTATFTKDGSSDGKAFCTFGPAWYYNFCMTPAMGDASKPETDDINVNKSYGDWALVKGPQAHFWGGTWALAATNGDNDDLVAKVMNEIIGEAFSTSILENESQFSNNKKANAAYSAKCDASGTGNGFLKGQNDTAVWVSMADAIRFKNVTDYDQACNEELQNAIGALLKGATATLEDALDVFYSAIETKYPGVELPE